jgi:hypothetical protein
MISHLACALSHLFLMFFHQHKARENAILHHVFIDAKWVAEEYLKRCQAGAWKKAWRPCTHSRH